MIEIKGEPRVAKWASDSVKLMQMGSIVRSWAKLEKDESVTDDQRNIVARSAMSRIWQIMEEEG